MAKRFPEMVARRSRAPPSSVAFADAKRQDAWGCLASGGTSMSRSLIARFDRISFAAGCGTRALSMSAMIMALGCGGCGSATEAIPAPARAAGAKVVGATDADQKDAGSARKLSHDFGILRPGEKASHTFAIRNDGPAPLDHRHPPRLLLLHLRQHLGPGHRAGDVRDRRGPVHRADRLRRRAPARRRPVRRARRADALAGGPGEGPQPALGGPPRGRLPPHGDRPDRPRLIRAPQLLRPRRRRPGRRVGGALAEGRLGRPRRDDGRPVRAGGSGVSR